jgi:exodeoxyribonuclease V alpha subunit
MNRSILMVAPTGRAAKRANESTGLPTSTVHRLLEYNGTTFQKDEYNQIQTDILVIDECSMIDAPLLLQLLKATPLKTKIIFVGDVDQLPSVGPGQTLKDMIDSEKVPVTRLTEIFRQAADSPIITLAYAVNRGEMPNCEDHEDLEYIEFEEEEHVCQKTVEIASKLYKENDLFDVQVLVPMNKGKVGIKKINNELQARLTKPEPSVKIGDYEIRLDDKVIQTKNDYERSIYNGDVGKVTYVSNHLIKVKFQGSEEETRYTKEKFQELKLSYAITVHRSQGSEYKYAIIPTVNSYSRMLQKNLLYTAITRAKKKLWMIYQQSALEECVKLTSVPRRNTTLCELLKIS